MKTLKVYLLVVVLIAGCATSKIHKKATDNADSQRGLALDNVPFEVRLVLNRLESLKLGLKPLRSASLEILGIEADRWELAVASDKSIELDLYVVKHQSDAFAISKVVSGAYPSAISGPSVLVVKGKEISKSTIDAILSAYSGEE